MVKETSNYATSDCVRASTKHETHSAEHCNIWAPRW